MSAQEVLIADAVAAELNDPARPWTFPGAATRTWSPWYAAEEGDLNSLKVSVVPVAQKTKEDPVDRAGTRLFDYEVWIDLQQRVTLTTDGQVSQDDVDNLCLTCQQVQDWFNDLSENTHELAALPGWHVIKAERPLIFNPDELYQNHVFVSSIGLTVRGFR